MLRLSDDRFKMGGLVFSTSARRVFDPVLAMAVAVAVVVGSLWMQSPPAQSSAAARSATIAVELRALAVQTVPVGQLAAESFSVSDAVGADTVDPVQVISGVANLAVTVAGAALWLAAFPITLPATMIGLTYFSAVAGFFACFCFRLPAPDELLINGLSTFLEIPRWAVQNAMAALQPDQSVSPAATARAAAATGTPPSPADPAVLDRTGVPPSVGDASEVAVPAAISVPSASEAVRSAGRRGERRTESVGAGAGGRPVSGTRFPGVGAVLPAQASEPPSASGETAVTGFGPRSRATRRAAADPGRV